MTAALNPTLRRVASASLVALLLLCLAWEIFLAPLRPGGSLLFRKALPLALPAVWAQLLTGQVHQHHVTRRASAQTHLRSCYRDHRHRTQLPQGCLG